MRRGTRDAPPRERDRGRGESPGTAGRAREVTGVHILYVGTETVPKQSRPHRQHATEYGSENNMWGVGTCVMSGERGVWARGRIEASATHHRVYSSENNMIGTHIRGTQTSDVDLQT